MIEQRRYARYPVDSPATFSLKGKTEKVNGLVKDISIGGVFLETASPAGFGADITIHVVLPGSDATLSLPGVVRWVRDGGMGIQFGLLGAKETHIITEIGRKHAEKAGR